MNQEKGKWVDFCICLIQGQFSHLFPHVHRQNIKNIYGLDSFTISSKILYWRLFSLSFCCCGSLQAYIFRHLQTRTKKPYAASCESDVPEVLNMQGAFGRGVDSCTPGPGSSSSRWRWDIQVSDGNLILEAQAQDTQPSLDDDAAVLAYFRALWNPCLFFFFLQVS